MRSASWGPGWAGGVDSIPADARPAPARTAARHARSRHRTSTSSSRSTAVEGRRRPRSRRGVEQHRARERPPAAPRAAAIRPASSALPIGSEGSEGRRGQEQRRLGQDGRVGRLAGEGQRHRRWDVSVDDRAEIGRARWMARWIARSDVGAAGGAERRRARPRVAEADDDQVGGPELVLAPPRGRHEEALAREPDERLPYRPRSAHAPPSRLPAATIRAAAG